MHDSSDAERTLNTEDKCIHGEHMENTENACTFTVNAYSVITGRPVDVALSRSVLLSSRDRAADSALVSSRCVPSSLLQNQLVEDSSIPNMGQRHSQPVETPSDMKVRNALNNWVFAGFNYCCSWCHDTRMRSKPLIFGL